MRPTRREGALRTATGPSDEPAAAKRALDGFARARVVCVGDIMLDQYIYGRVERVSAEAPIPVLRARSQRAMLGGVGNVARNVVALGAEAVLIAVTGDDAVAGRIADLAKAEPRLKRHLIAEDGRPSTQKTRYVADGQQLLRADDETTAPISEDTSARLMTLLRSALCDADAIVLSDYRKGVLTERVLFDAIAAATAAGVPVVADPKRDDFGIYGGVTILKPNQVELATATGLRCDTDAEVEKAARRVMDQCPIEAILVSRSARGLSLVQRNAPPIHVAARALEVFDVSGAGDTVVSTAAVALAAGAALPAVAELANTAGGIVVGKPGTAVVTRDELAAKLIAADVAESEEKVVSPEAAEGRVGEWRRAGERVGFTNGCFDLLHPGHVSLLEEARSDCDRLIVAVNGDESVRRLKGEDRPVQSETARALVLASLSMVDLVIVFPDDTPTPLLERLRPDLLVKGGDYALDEVVGADVVRAYGGAVKLARWVPGHSSSEVIARLSAPDEPAVRNWAGRSRG